MAGQPPTTQELAQQIVRMDAELQALRLEVKVLTDKSPSRAKEFAGLVDRKHMMIEKLERNEDWN